MSRVCRDVYHGAEDSVETETLELQRCMVDLARGDVRTEAGATDRLSARELSLLRFLAERPGTTVSRDDLLQRVFGYSDQTLSRACDNVVRRLRQKLESDPARPHHILTVRGEGYRFQPLVAAVEEPAIVAPVPSATSTLIVIDQLQVDLARHVALREGETVALTARESQILALLHNANGAVVSRTALVRAVWGHAAGRAIDHAVHRLRQKLEPDPSNPRFLHTVRGAGYRLLVPEEPSVSDAGSTFVGREQPMAELEALSGAGTWVVLVGPGGIGKTRLVRHWLAGRSGTRWFVSLASCTTASAAVARVAEALGLVLAGADDPVLRVGAALRRRGPATLVLDNLEQLATSLGAVVRAWQDAAPEMAFVGTSRVRLSVPGEQLIEVGPMSSEHGAELYATRARAVWSGYRLRGPEIEAVHRVVEHVGGSPLAIELAAARVSVLPATSLVPRLDRALALLVRPAGGGGPHDSLEATFSVSIGLLDEAERAALLHLGLFRSGFGLLDVEALRGPGGLDELQTLRDHHLVYTRSAAPRFGIVEPLRAYLTAQRELADDGAAMEFAWATWVARVGHETALDSVRTGRPHEDSAALRSSIADLEAALPVALSAEAPQLAVDCLCALIAATVHHQPRADALSWAERVRSLDLADAQAARVDAWCALTQLYRDRSDEVLPLAERVIEQAHQHPRLRAVGWSVVAKVQQRSGGGAEGTAYAHAAKAFDEADEPARAAFCQARSLLAGGDREAARRAFLLAERLADDQEEHLTQAHALRELGVIDASRGRVEAASSRLEAALAAFEASDWVAGAYAVLYFLQDLYLWAGQTTAFAAVTQGALAAAQRRGSSIEEACSLALAAAHALAIGHHDEAETTMVAARVALRRRSEQEPSRRALLDWVDAELALSQGRTDDAQQLASAARHTLESMGIPAAVAVATTAAAALGASGAGLARATEATHHISDHVPPSYAAFAWARRGLLAAEAGQNVDALQALERATSLARSAEVDAPTGWAGRLIQALRQRTDTEETQPRS